MRKNMLMRAASGLFVATMLTTSVVSGTFAKYVTSASAGDAARVAKFGVEVLASGTLFSENYIKATNTPGTTSDTLTVKSSGSAGDDVVAPGTQNDDGLVFSVSGTPEVAVEVKIELTSASTDNPIDVFLKAAYNKYYDMTTGTDASDTFDLSADYYPIKYTLSKLGNDATYSAVSDCNGVALSAIETYLDETLTTASKFNPGDDLSSKFGTYKLTWKWGYDTSADSTSNDKADTLLGDLAAEKTVSVSTLTKGIDYNLEPDIQFVITVTQVD